MSWRRLAPPRKGDLGLLVCLRVGGPMGPEAVNRLAKVCGIFCKRFDASVVVGMEGLEHLDAQVPANWLADGLIIQSICSGHRSLVLNDLVDAAIRSNAVSTVFMDVDQLLLSPARALQFMVENLGKQAVSILSADSCFLQVGRPQLLDLPRRRFPAAWPEGLRFIDAACRQETKGIIEKQDIADLDDQRGGPYHLFVTEAGVQRLGGRDRFQKLSLRVGGLAVNDFDQISLLALEDAKADGSQRTVWRKVSAVAHTAPVSTEKVVFDIWPAPYVLAVENGQSDGAWLDVPRQVLVGRRCPVSIDTEKCCVGAQEAVFIMSNFNKAAYLPAALYGWVMQTYPNIRLDIVDDVSNDASLAKITEFKRLTGLDDTLLSVSVNECKRGTYWIRNLVISRHLREGVVFFVNDSDDVSSTMRATLQMGTLATDEKMEVCLFNIVRVDENYSLLPLNNEVERYGTASLCFKASLISKVGYFQNIQKNADWEFIRRVRRFIGPPSPTWIKMLALFQTFDGVNLTADIYKIVRGGSGIAANLGLRRQHIEIANRHYESLSLEGLPRSFDFPLSTMQEEYAQLGDDFLMEGYKRPDSVIVLLDGDDLEKENDFLQAGFIVLAQSSGNCWSFKSANAQETVDGEGFVEALAGYTARHVLSAYVISSRLITAPGRGMDWQDCMRDEYLFELVVASKAKGDKFVLRSDGVWSEAATFLNRAGTGVKDETNPDRQLNMLHTSVVNSRFMCRVKSKR
ncbi:glycosyltransferase family A protein [Desulfurivibrio alkaliphilus]|uniref:Glycosyltransferase 2-like domain-containing protein n=1 Tax=Desulfurivibrio alkaliphilus (strain DSM 19089 / UNIQEM U267 / AHT2) TaxID=589865 RepID=D6Z4M5_DESAT|nr:glycosyltransferase family A protein [Desulfurivibrio alkaliphilus]ADH86500.1 hypothetical protein DaAHT2_1809 [Desulfurivibrio alkaliphilus AHT 2]